MRALTFFFAFASLTFASLGPAACGSGEDTSGNDGPGEPRGPGGPGDPNADGGGANAPGLPPVDGPLAFTDRLVGWSGGYTGGFYSAHGYAVAGRRLFSVPDALSSTLRAVTVVDVSAPAKPRVVTLPVSGKVPSGTVEAFTYDASIDRTVLVVRARNATDVSLVAIAIDDKQATFTTLTQAGPIPKSNSLIGPLIAKGAGGTIIAALGNTTAAFTVSGTTATWSAESQGSIFPGNAFGIMEDSTHGRALSVGHYVYDSTTMKATLEPAITTLALAAPYTWTALPYGGDTPPSTDTFGYDFSVYDAKGDRVLASFLHDVTCFPGQPSPCKATGLWSFALATGTWTKLVDNWSSSHAYAGARPFLVDQDNRRILTPNDGVLASTSLDPSNTNLDDVMLAQDGDLGPASPSAATVLGDGRIVTTDGGAFRVLDPNAATPRWTRLGTATFPSALGRDASLSADPSTGELLVFGGAANGAAAELHIVSADAKTITKTIPAGNAPSARTLHGAIVAGGVLYVGGGSTSGNVGGGALDDVWSFDRATKAWTKIATLPTAIFGVTLATTVDGDLLVAGRTAGSASMPSPVFAIDHTSHAVRTLDAPPAKNPLWAMAPYRGCLLGYESGDTVDGSGPTAWRCTIDATGKLSWTSTKLDEHDFTLNDLRATASPDGLHAYFVGRHLWDVVGK